MPITASRTPTRATFSRASQLGAQVRPSNTTAMPNGLSRDGAGSRRPGAVASGAGARGGRTANRL
jgi:hypothetical protein